jgi:hypothetical protein
MTDKEILILENERLRLGNIRLKEQINIKKAIIKKLKRKLFFKIVLALAIPLLVGFIVGYFLYL